MKSVSLFWLMILGQYARSTTATISLTTNSSFSAPNGSGVCPLRAPVEFICNETNTLSVTWRIKGQSLLILASDTTTDHLQRTGVDGIQVQLVSVIPNDTTGDRGNMTTRLVVDPFALSFGDQVSCTSTSGSKTLTYSKLAPPPVVPVAPNVTKEAGNSVKLTLQWNNAFTENHSVDEYCVIAPAGNVCPLETTCLTPDTDYECSGLVAGNQYEFVVYGKNCGNQTGTTTTTIIYPQVPGQPSMCSSVPVYDRFTNRLIAIQNTWTAAPNPTMEITSGAHQDVLFYDIFFESHSNDRQIFNGNKSVSAMDVCSGERCTYTLSTSFFGSHYTLSVAAENIAGLGEHLTCTPDHINTFNNIVIVAVNATNPSNATVECSLTWSSAGSCKVCYKDRPNCQNLTCLPPVSNNGDGIPPNITIKLPNTLNSESKYCYSVDIVKDAPESDENQTLPLIVIHGSFSTVCDVEDLGKYGYHYEWPLNSIMYAQHDVLDIIQNDIVDPRCDSTTVGSLPLPNGVVCYNGTSFGSTAYYICNENYQVPGYSDCHGNHQCNQRECQGDGHWSGETLPCLSTLNEQCRMKSTDCDVGISFCFIFLLFIGTVTVLIIVFIIRWHVSRQKSPCNTTSLSSEPPRCHTLSDANDMPNYLEYADDTQESEDIDETCGDDDSNQSTHNENEDSNVT